MSAENCEADFIEKCDFKLINTSNYTKGSIYFIEQDTFHKVTSNNCITCLSRPVKPTKEKARVARIDGQPKVCPFSKKVEEKELWEIVQKMLK